MTTKRYKISFWAQQTEWKQFTRTDFWFLTTSVDLWLALSCSQTSNCTINIIHILHPHLPPINLLFIHMLTLMLNCNFIIMKQFMGLIFCFFVVWNFWFFAFLHNLPLSNLDISQKYHCRLSPHIPHSFKIFLPCYFIVFISRIE